MLFRTLPAPSRTGINRNILECKLNIDGNAAILPEVLIETYWNVNKDVIDAMQKTREY